MDIDKARQLTEQAKALCRENNATLLYLAVCGSRLFGTDFPGKSDLDIHGIFLPSAQSAFLGNLPRCLHWSSSGSQSRNSADDVDIDLWSVQYWLLKLLSDGDTGAVDLLFSPSNQACLLYCDPCLDGVFSSPSRLLETKNFRAYAEYSLKQARKYGAKGSRLSALLRLREWLETECRAASHDARLKDVLEPLAAACADGQHCAVTENSGEPALSLCGKIHTGSTRLSELDRRVRAQIAQYGSRAQIAEQHQGVDCKALSHALRAFDQMEEIYRTGRITFPLKTREQIKAVKCGAVSPEAFDEMFAERLSAVNAAREHSTVVCAFDEEFAKSQILACYESGRPAVSERTLVFDSGFSVPEGTSAAILDRLAALERQHDIRILYAVESGSRGWGFASADSDYDVRFLYVHRPEWYLGQKLKAQADTIDLPVEETPAGVLDISGWDLEKALGLLEHGNASLIEWLSSPLIYIERGGLARQMREIAQRKASFYRLWHHYSGMFRTAAKQYEHEPGIKRWFYVVRPLFMMLWIERKRMPPPMRFDAVMDGAGVDESMKRSIAAIIENKRQGREEDLFQPPQEVGEFLEAAGDRAISQVPQFDAPMERLDCRQLFVDILREAWPASEILRS